MVLSYEYSKGKLLKNSGRTYPYKKTEVEKALIDGGVTELKDFRLMKQRSSDPDMVIITAVLYGESHAGYWMKSKPSLFVYSVPSVLAKEIKELLSEKKMLKKVIQWLVALEGASNVVRDVTREISVCYADGELFIKNEQGKRMELS